MDTVLRQIHHTTKNKTTALMVAQVGSEVEPRLCPCAPQGFDVFV